MMRSACWKASRWASIMSTADLVRGAADLDALAAAARGVGGGGLTPPAGLPDPALLARLANQFFAALPGQSVPVSAGPSLSGFGASPVEVAGTSAPHAASAATSPFPTAVPVHAANVPVAPGPFDASALDEKVLDTLIGSIGPGSVPSSTPGPSAPGFGTTDAGLAAGAQTVGAPAAVGSTPSPSLATASHPQPSSIGSVDVLDLSAVNAWSAPQQPLPSSIDAGPSLAGHGTSSEIASGGDAPARSALPGNGASSIPQPPPYRRRSRCWSMTQGSQHPCRRELRPAARSNCRSSVNCRRCLHLSMDRRLSSRSRCRRPPRPTSSMAAERQSFPPRKALDMRRRSVPRIPHSMCMRSVAISRSCRKRSTAVP